MSRYIDADKFLNRIKELVSDNEWYENLFCADSVCGLVEEAPTIDAVPVVHGHWVEKLIPTGVSAFGVDEMTCEELECSVCHKLFWVGEERNYCPYCGAKMDEVTDDAQ